MQFRLHLFSNIFGPYTSKRVVNYLMLATSAKQNAVQKNMKSENRQDSFEVYREQQCDTIILYNKCYTSS